MKYIEIHKDFYPTHFKLKDVLSEITWVDGDYVPTKIRVYYFDVNGKKRIDKVLLNRKHPNADPETDLLCLPEELQNLEDFNEYTLLPNLEPILFIWDFDDCYFRPEGKYRFKVNDFYAI